MMLGLHGEGYEYHPLALAVGVPLVIAGGGRYAVDSWLRARLPEPRAMLATQS